MRGVAMSAVLAGTFLVVGCSGPVVVSPSPSPSVFGGGPAMGECVFEQGKSAEPCSKSLAERMAADEALYVEAEAVLRRHLAEDERISRAEGLATPELMETVTGDLAAVLPARYEREREKKLRWLDGAVVLGFVRRAPMEVKDNSVVTLDYCQDSTGLTLSLDGGQSYHGAMLRAFAYFVQVDGSLRIADLQGELGGETC